jgi:iron complex outermembrane receptor protein
MTISVVGREAIEQSTESALLPVLSGRVPGLFVTQRSVTGFGVGSSGAGNISLRGVGGGNEVLVLIDGHPQYMGVMGHHLPDAYVASDVEKVEVVRGPASILYGSNAMGGVINIITRKQNEEGWSANARMMYGSFNTQKYMGNGGVKKGKLDAFVSINHDRTDGNRDDKSARFNITNGYAKAGYQLSEHFRAWGDVSLASYETQNPGATDAPMLDNVANILRGVASLPVDNEYAKTDGAFKLFYNFGDHKIDDGYTAGGNPRAYLFRSKDYNYGINWYQIFRPFAGNMITAGVDFKDFGGKAWDDYSRSGKEDVQWVDTSLYEVAGYVLVQQTLFEKLTLNAGVRLENNRQFGAEWVPQAGVAYRPLDATVLKASVSKGFRSPNIRDLYYRAGWAGANPDLKPERMINYEASVGQSFLDGRLSAELTGFIADGSNLIVADWSHGYPPTNYNTGTFNNKGVELSVKWNAIKNLHLHGNYSYLNMDKLRQYAPEQQIFLSANYRFKQWGFGVDYQYIKDMYAVVGETPVKETYGLLGARVSFRPLRWFDVFVKGENLTNKQYEIMAGFPMAGVTVMAGVNLNLALLN